MTVKLRDQILVEMVPVEENDFARGINQGLRKALQIVDTHDCAESIKAALNELKAKGMKTGGDVPYGYRRTEDGSTALVEDEEEQKVITMARRLRKAGKKLREIANELRRRGKRTRDKGPFDPKQISRMLKPSRLSTQAKAATATADSPASCTTSEDAAGAAEELKT